MIYNVNNYYFILMIRVSQRLVLMIMITYNNEHKIIVINIILVNHIRYYHIVNYLLHSFVVTSFSINLQQKVF